MTYIVGGTPRSGKSIVQRILLEKYKVSGITTDLLREAFMYGVPSFGIVDDGDDFKKAEILWPYFKGLLTARKNYSDTLLLEGTNFLPKYLHEFTQNPEMRICFLGYSYVDPLQKFKDIRNNESPNDNWTAKESDQSLINYINEFIQTSKYFKDECSKYNIKYFDTSENFETVISQVVDFLVN